MTRRNNVHTRQRRRQGGAAAVEFALVAPILFLLLIGIFEFGRLMFTWNAAVEATRRGARLAVVCDLGDAQIKAQMRSMVGALNDADINIAYMPAGCTADTCESVTITILPTNQTANAYQYIIPDMNSSWKIPGFATTLTRESLQSGSGIDGNPDC